MKRFVVFMMSVALVFGLMPAASFGVSREAWGDLVVPSASDVTPFSEPDGLQLNDGPEVLSAKGATTKRYGVLWSYLKEGDVVVTFTGTVAPKLLLDRKVGQAFTKESVTLEPGESSVAWNADGTGGKWQVSRGTVLDVLGQKSGWYEVRLPKGERTAFIKQTLCADLSAKGRPSGTRSRRGGGSSSPSPSALSGTTPSAAEGTVSTAPAPGTSEEVVEEIVTNNSDDEVFF